jgi:hypothetical protein
MGMCALRNEDSMTIGDGIALGAGILAGAWVLINVVGLIFVMIKTRE